MAKTLMLLLFSLKEGYDRKTLPGSVQVANFYPDVLMGFVVIVVVFIYSASSKTQMGKCQSAELVSMGTPGFPSAAALQTLPAL